MSERSVETRRIEQVIKIASGWLIGFAQFSPDGRVPHNRIVLLTNAEKCRLKSNQEIKVLTDKGLKNIDLEEYEFPEIKIFSVACMHCPNYKNNCNLV